MIGADTIKFNFKKHKFVFFDFETSCLNLGIDYNKVWQASWVVYHGYELIETHDYFVKWPNFYISPGAAAATRFNPDMWAARGQDPKMVLDKFEAYLYDPQYIICGQNILGFDVYLHTLWRKSFGLKPDFSYMDRLIDIRALAVAYKTNSKFKADEDFLAQQYRFLNYRQRGLKTNLTQLCLDLGIEVDPNKMHNALEDNLKAFQVFTELIRKLEI
jgi:DNA polymerase III alpha subunit (gram-positive type)